MTRAPCDAQSDDLSTGLPCILPETLAAALQGEGAPPGARLLLLDCRYPYEHSGGCIRSAINVQVHTTAALDPEGIYPIPRDAHEHISLWSGNRPGRCCVCVPGSEPIGWLLQNYVEASFDLFRYLLLGDDA